MSQLYTSLMLGGGGGGVDGKGGRGKERGGREGEKVNERKCW